jgi:hypothetical protein
MVNGRLHGEQVVAASSVALNGAPPCARLGAQIVPALAQFKDFEFAKETNHI